MAVKKEKPKYFSLPVFLCNFVEWTEGGGESVLVAKSRRKIYSGFRGHDIGHCADRPAPSADDKNERRKRNNNPEEKKNSLSIFKFVSFPLSPFVARFCEGKTTELLPTNETFSGSPPPQPSLSRHFFVSFSFSRDIQLNDRGSPSLLSSFFLSDIILFYFILFMNPN